MSREFAVFGLRMPPDLRAALEIACETSGKSLNAEIVYRLQKTLEASREVSRIVATDGVMTEHEAALLSAFRSMAPSKQLAMLSLFTTD